MCEFVSAKRIESSSLGKFWVLAPFFFILSCRTLPELTHSNIVGGLPPESSIIMKIEVPGNEALLEILMLRFGIEGGNFSAVRKRIEHLAIGLEVDSPLGGGQTNRVPFHAIVIGDWPKVFFGELLGEEWSKSGRNRWISPTGLEIMLASKRELVISSGRLDSMLLRIRIASRNAKVTAVGLSTENVDLAFWITDPDLIQRYFPPLPVRDFTEALIVDSISGTLGKVDQDTYSIDMSIHLTNPHFVESLALAMRLGFAAQIGRTYNFLDYEFLAGLDVKEGESEVVISHHSIPIDLLENFLNFDFGLGGGVLDSRN